MQRGKWAQRATIWGNVENGRNVQHAITKGAPPPPAQEHYQKREVAMHANAIARQAELHDRVQQARSLRRASSGRFGPVPGFSGQCRDFRPVPGFSGQCRAFRTSAGLFGQCRTFRASAGL